MKNKLHIYRRVSQKIQETEGDSLTTQLEIGKDVCKRLKKQKVVSGFKDWNEGPKSSSKDDFSNRPILNRLLLEIEQGNVKHLFCYDTDRLSRNEKTWFIIRQSIKDNNVKLHTRNGELDLNDPTDSFLTGILGYVNQYTNEQRKIRSIIGRENQVRQGKFPGGEPNFGYVNIDKKYRRNEEEVVWVKKMFNIMDKGGSIKQISELFTNNGVKPKRSKTWNFGTIQKMLMNRIYVGEHMWKGIQMKTPQIISHSQFDRVQKKLGSRYISNNKTHFYLLTPLITCGHCGSTFYGMNNIKNGSKIYYCPTKQNNWRGNGNKKCSLKKNINIERTDELVWNSVLETVSSSVFMKERFKTDILKQKGKNVETVTQQIRKLDKRIKRLKLDEHRILKGISNIEVERLTEKILPETYQMTKDSLVDGLNGVRSSIQEVQDNISIKNEEKGWVDWVSRYGFELEKKSKMSNQEKKDYLHRNIEEIIVKQTDSKEGHELQIKFKLPIYKDSLSYKDKTNKRKGYEVKEGKSERGVFLEHKLGNPNNVFKKKVSNSTHMLNLLHSYGLS